MKAIDKMALVYKGYPPDLCCCDTTLRQMPNGEWLVAFISGGPTEPLLENHILVIRSTDRGATWSEPEVLFQRKSEAILLSELMVIGEQSTIFLSVHNGSFGYWKSFYAISGDSGYTWSEMYPVPHRPARTFVRNAFHCANGELVLPFQHYTVQDEGEGSQSEFFLPENGVLVSSDNGESFEAFGQIHLGFRSWAENNVVELSNGSLVMFIRADGKGVLYRSDSHDGGRRWSEAYPTDIPNPGSKFRLHKLSDDRILLLHNPNLSKRHPLSLWVSDDDMKTWSYKRDLVIFPGRLAYPDGFVDEKEGYVHFTFDYNRHDVIYVGARLS